MVSGALMLWLAGQIGPTCDTLVVDSTGDTLVHIVSSDGAMGHLRVEVTRRSAGDYVYRYTVINDPQSVQSIFDVDIQVAGWDTTRDTFIVVDSMKAPAGWRSSTTPLTGRYPSWLDPERDSLRVVLRDPVTGDTATFAVLPPEVWNPRLRHRYGGFSWSPRISAPLVAPGDSVDSLIVYAPYPPDPAHLRVMGSGFAKRMYEILLDVPEFGWAWEMLDTCDRYHSYRTTPFAGVSPGWPVPNWPAAHAHLQDRIQRVDSLGWFRDAALRDTLTARLSAAYAAYKRRDYWEAYQHLSAAMTRLQQGRGSQIDDRGFFVLYYRFLEAREKLPSPARMEKVR